MGIYSDFYIGKVEKLDESYCLHIGFGNCTSNFQTLLRDPSNAYRWVESQGIPDNAVKHESHTIGLAIVDGEFVLGLVGSNGLIHFDSNDETLKTSTKYYTLTCTPIEVKPATKTQCREFLF